MTENYYNFLSKSTVNQSSSAKTNYNDYPQSNFAISKNQQEKTSWK